MAVDPYYNPNNYSYTPYNQHIGTVEIRRINLLEIGLVVIAIILLLVTSLFGFFSQATRNRDLQRQNDISQILTAIGYFYYHSSNNPAERFYPKSECSQKLNEVDFEYTLKQYLTGSRPNIEPHSYINPSDFPRDRWGVYSANFSDRKVNLQDCPQVFNQNSSTIYKDGSSSCNFLRKANNGYLRCYLYSGSQNGDKFELAYFSETQNQFIVYSKFRSENLKTEKLAIS